ncbi:MAG: ABC transporter ATP-binding protein [Magnetococcus sp. WYHC-3]
MTNPPIPPHPVEVERLSKRYGLPLVQRMGTLLRSLGGIRATTIPVSGESWALHEVSLRVAAGETLGVIGLNGSGKSTLLKILAGVSAPTRGRVTVRGGLYSMIELNAGVHMELTGRENIRLLGAVIGLSRRDMAARMAEIEAFCELGPWLDRPVRMYSSGMLVRLGFGVGIHVEADIMLMDEVLAVGDLSFYNKCLRHMEELRSRGRTTLFVSHNMHRVQRMCDRVLVLDRGRQLFVGDTVAGVRVYEEVVRRSQGASQGRQFDFLGISLESMHLSDGAGTALTRVAPGADVVLHIALQVSQPVQQARINVVLESVDAVSVVWETLELEELPAGRQCFEVVWQDLRLRAGDYPVRLGITSGRLGIKGFRVTGALVLHMEGDPMAQGLYRPGGRVDWRGGSGAFPAGRGEP